MYQGKNIPLESKHGVSGIIMMWWLLGGAGVGAWLFPCDLSCDHIGHAHKVMWEQPHPQTRGGTPLDGTKVV